jgi:Dyp-type peroxidase family
MQGNVLRPYDNDHAAYLFVEVDEPAAGRRLLAELAPDLTPATPWVVPPAVTTNLAFTATGLERLGMRPAHLATFPAAFRQGMARRAASLGDRHQAAPEKWEPGLSDGTAHLLIGLSAWRSDRLEERASQLAARLDRDGGLCLAYDQRAERFDDRREHFGFLDGVAQPRLAGIDPAGTPSMGTPGRLRWRALPIGEFVLGHVDAEGVPSPAPAGGWARNGSYVVVRKLHQDVAAFRSLVQDTGRDFPGGPELLAAKIVGRWPDGTPLALSPHGPDPRLSLDPARINDFRFADDPEGLRCPVGAHIRRANPRDGAGVGGAMTTRHRLLRRGLPYGPRLAPGCDDDGGSRGLIFVCFAADIERQFEFLQRRWLNDGDVLGLRGDPDPLLGLPEPGDKFKVPGSPPYLLELRRPLVIARGGAYLFQPAVSAVRTIATRSV